MFIHEKLFSLKDEFSFKNLFDISDFFHIIRSNTPFLNTSMIHVVIVHDTTIFRLIREQTEAKKVPLMGISYHVFSHGNIRII